MTQDELKEYKKKISNLTVNEQKMRDLHLRDLSLGLVEGPLTGYASIDKPWLQYYKKEAIMNDVPKVKAYDYIVFNNIGHLDEIAISYLGSNTTFKDLYKNVDDAVKAFRKVGVKQGDIVTVAMATTPELVYTIYALNRIGAVANAIDPRLTEEEITKIVNDSDSKVFVGIDMATEKMVKVKNKTNVESIINSSPFVSAGPIVKILGKLKYKEFKNAKSWKAFIKEGKRYTGKLDEEFAPDEPVIIVYTGGTTGAPKGVVLTNENFNAMAFTQVFSGFNLERGDSFLNFLPPFYAYSIVNAVHDPLVLGFRTILVPMFEPADFPKLMAQYKPNHVLSGPILWDILMKDEKYNKMDLSYLKSPISGGDSMNLELEHSINAFLHKNGCKYNIQQGYGMSEVAAAACYSSEKSYSPGSVGVPYPKNIVSIFDRETGEELGYNQEGEVKIATPTMMKGYFNNEEETKKAINKDEFGTRWISTGDLGRMDQNGRLYLVGRVKRMIVRAGNKIFPLNIENIITSVPGVEQCCVVGMPDEEEKTVPIAFMVLEPNSIGEEEIVNSIKKLIPESLPSFNIPKKFVITDDLPITTMQKVDFTTLEKESVAYADEKSEIIVDKHREKGAKILQKK